MTLPTMFDFPAVVENILLFHAPGLVCILDLKNSDILSNDRMSNLFPSEQEITYTLTHRAMLTPSVAGFSASDE